VNANFSKYKLYWQIFTCIRPKILNAQVKLESAELIDDLDIKVIETFLFENSQMEVECYFWVHFKVNLSSCKSSL
jgi:hypothetical protein